MKFFKTTKKGTYPERATDGSAGFDIVATSWEEMGDVLIYDTGVKINKLPPNTHVKLYPRSSIFKTDLRLANSVGVIDADYPDTIKVLFDYRKDKSFGDLNRYNVGDRIAQLVIEPHFVEEEEIIRPDLVGKPKKKTKKRKGGLGSTGK